MTCLIILGVKVLDFCHMGDPCIGNEDVDAPHPPADLAESLFDERVVRDVEDHLLDEMFIVLAGKDGVDFLQARFFDVTK